MSQHRVPFTAEYDAHREQLTLTGDLDGDRQAMLALQGTLREVADGMPPEKLLIITDHMRLVPEGVSLWIAEVSAHLDEVMLFYKCGQLPHILKYDERYAHPRTTYFGDY